MSSRSHNYKDFNTPELGEYICAQIIESLRKICEREDMPARITVFRWLEKYPEFEANYLRARRLQADYMDDLIPSKGRMSGEQLKPPTCKICKGQRRREKISGAIPVSLL
jgi:hypothetical protein